MNAKIFAILIVFVANFRLCQGLSAIRYDNYIMYRTVPTQNDQLEFLKNLDKYKYIEVLFWEKPHKLYQDVQFIVNPKDNEQFLERVKHYGVKVDEINSNVQSLFDRQNYLTNYTKHRTDTYYWDEYHTLADIYQWMSDVVLEFPKICKLISIGKSAENRNIYALSILRKKTKGTVIIEGGAHGREWVSAEVVTYLARSLIHADTDDDPRLKVVANHYQWFLVPVLNPDGYEYSQATDRLWKKNRRLNSNGTYGVDLNRNFNYSFCEFGTSNNSADDTYCGPGGLSEPETLEYSKFVITHSSDLKYYFSFHSYGQKIIIPYGDKILHVDNYADCANIATQAIMKIYKMYGRKYSVGNSYDVLGHKVSGDSASWVKKTFNVPYAFTFLLRDNGTYGYGLPTNEIIPACREAQNGVLEIMTTSVKKLRADIFGTSAGSRGASCGVLITGVVIWQAK